MKYIALALLLLVTAVGCSMEEHPSQTLIENNLPVGGPQIKYDPESSFINIDQVTENLNASHSEKFKASLGWYGTESTFGLEKLHGKTAKEVVDIVNCLKKSEKVEQQSACFE